MSPRHVGVVRFAEVSPVPWRNGGGTTRELLTKPCEDEASGNADAPEFDWRLSVADVTAPGPFSTFAGVDRVLMLCRGAGMDVDVDGHTHRLGRYDAVRFAGEATTSASPVAGPTLDLNVMTRRDRFRATVTLQDLPGTRTEDTAVVAAGPGATAVVVVLDGSVHHDGPDRTGLPLQPFDAVRVVASSCCRLTGRGRLARIVLTPVDPTEVREERDRPCT